MNVPMMLVLTLGSYLLGVWVRKKSGIALLHPFLICVPVIIAVLSALDIPCDYYMEANGIISFLLGPSVVALGLMLYDHIDVIRANLLPMLVAVAAGSITGVASVWLLCRVFSLDSIFFISLEAKSVTTPIALDISGSLGGSIALTAISVVLCGFIGAVFGPMLIRLFRIKSPVAKGLAMGCASHGLGTAKAIEMGAVEGAVSGLAIALMGLATAIVVPLFNMLVC